MNATLQALVTAVATLTTSVQALVAKSNAQIDPAAVQPVVDSVNALNAQVQAVVSPPAPVPTPAPAAVSGS